MSRSRGFTLVELLVVLAITALLIATLLPSLGEAKKAAVRVQCAANERQQGIMLGQYASDSHGYVPAIGSPHRTTSFPYPGICQVTSGSNTSCPLGALWVWPVGMGWFYVMGYLRPVVPTVGKVLVLDCPAAPIWGNTAATWQRGLTQTVAAEKQYKEFSQYTTCLASGDPANAANPQGGGVTWDCNNDAQGRIGYTTRGTWGGSNRSERWTSDKAFALDNWGDHGDGDNILFHDGHSAFGNKNIDGLPSYLWYSMNVNTYSYANAVANSYPGYAYAGGNGTPRLWAYYETGIQ